VGYLDFYRGRRVMITGGLGFIGSNLARRLVELGADVLLVDSLIPDYGGNLFNVEGIADRVRVNIADVRQQRKGIPAGVKLASPAIDDAIVVGKESPEKGFDRRMPVLGRGERHRQRKRVAFGCSPPLVFVDET
jgi:NAD(P)-dependent dehydrogenase (short-subunit alcohol dehydrogenase family)